MLGALRGRGIDSHILKILNYTIFIINWRIYKKQGLELKNEALTGLKAGVSRAILRSRPYYAKATKGSTRAIHPQA